MERLLRQEWRTKLSPRLIAIKGVGGIGIGQFGLEIRLEHDTPDIREKVAAIFESAAPDIPFIFKPIDRKVKVA